MPSYIRVKNFEKFQHYKDRTPTWIKLYNDVLDDYAFGQLPDASKWLAIGIWLLASRYQNAIRNDPDWIAKKVNATETVDLSPLANAGFIEIYDDASNSLAETERAASLARVPALAREEAEKRTTPSIRLHARDEIESQANEIIRLANRGMAENPAIGDACNPIPLGHGSRSAVIDWLNDGIPPAIVGSVVFERAKEYKPVGPRKQISTMRYFDAAIREAGDRAQAKATPVPVWEEPSLPSEAPVSDNAPPELKEWAERISARLQTDEDSRSWAESMSAHLWKLNGEDRGFQRMSRSNQEAHIRLRLLNAYGQKVGDPMPNGRRLVGT